MSLPYEGMDLGGPRVNPSNTSIVKQKAGQEPWLDLRSRKVGLQSLVTQSLQVPEGGAGSGGRNQEARPSRSLVQPELSWTDSVLILFAWCGPLPSGGQPFSLLPESQVQWRSGVHTWFCEDQERASRQLSKY